MAESKSRMMILLQNAQVCFRDTRSPFEHSELVAQNVTSDECFDLSNAIAGAIEFYLNHREQATDEAMEKTIRDELGPEAASMAMAQRPPMFFSRRRICIIG